MGSNDTASASSPGWRPRSSTRVSFCPATTCALVTTSPSPGDPAGALDAQPAGVAEDLHHRAARPRRTPGARAIDAVGAGTRASGPSMRGNGSSRASASSSPLDGGSTRVEVLQDRRALHLAPRLAAVGERQRAEHPRDPEPDARGQHRAQEPVDRGRRGRSHPPAQSRPHPFEADREHHPRDQRPHQAERGRPRRPAPVVEQQRPDPRARPTRRPRSRPAPARPRRTPAPSRTGPAARRRPRSASRCRSRLRAYRRARTSIPLTSSRPRPRTRHDGTRSPTPPLRPARRDRPRSRSSPAS